MEDKSILHSKKTLCAFQVRTLHAFFKFVVFVKDFFEKIFAMLFVSYVEFYQHCNISAVC